MQSELMPIGEVAARAGLRPSALRYYEQAGLLPPPARAGGKRRYAAGVLDRLTLIRFCQRVGFTIAEIRELLARTGGADAGRDGWRELAGRKLAEVDALLDEAASVRRLLVESLACDCVRPEACIVAREAARGR